MTKNKKIALGVILLVVLMVILIIIPHFYIRATMVEHDVYSESEKVQEAFQNYDVVQCKFRFFNPEYAFISHLHYIYPERDIDTVTLRIDFYNLNRENIFTKNWDVQRTGGATIESTTFSELVEMVKDDCSQFQQAKGNSSDETINWSYSPYKPEPPKEPEVEYTEGMAETMRERAIKIGEIKRELEEANK